MVEQETCQNPWRKRKCTNSDITLYIMYKGRELPICKNCADKIAKSDLEWGEK